MLRRMAGVPVATELNGKRRAGPAISLSQGQVQDRRSRKVQADAAGSLDFVRDDSEDDRKMGTLRLGVNIDHIATLRQARYATMPDSKNAEPDPIAAASICERAGAHGITAHLRADRRHIQDRDMERLRANIMTKLNFEMGNTPEIVDVAIRIRPDEVCLVPEKRAEVTTEGGLDVVATRRNLLNTIQRLHANGIRVSLFIDPDEKQIDCAAELGVEMIELHTGKLANAFTENVEAQELNRLCQCARRAHSSKLQVNAGHGINYRNIALIHKIPHLAELNIGHAIVSRAIFVGWEDAVREMLALMENYGG
jgi:pyridoxine 5-phosphate synthase